MIYALIFILVFSATIVAVLLWGGWPHKLTVSALFVYWCISWAFDLFNHPYGIYVFAFANMLFAMGEYDQGRTKYGWRIGVAFAVLVVAGGLAGLGILSLERGLGWKGITYWNLQSIVLLYVCIMLIGASYAGRTKNFHSH